MKRWKTAELNSRNHALGLFPILIERLKRTNRLAGDDEPIHSLSIRRPHSNHHEKGQAVISQSEAD